MRFPASRCQALYDSFMSDHALRLTATQAARNFSGLLDHVEEGGEIVIERRGKAVAVVTARRSEPRRISECLKVSLPRASSRPDPGFALDLNDVIAGNPVGQPPAWD